MSRSDESIDSFLVLMEQKQQLLNAFKSSLHSLLSDLENNNTDTVEEYLAKNNETTDAIDDIDIKINALLTELDSTTASLLQSAMTTPLSEKDFPQWVKRIIEQKNEQQTLINDLIQLNQVCTVLIQKALDEAKSNLKKTKLTSKANQYYASFMNDQIGILLDKKDIQ